MAGTALTVSAGPACYPASRDPTTESGGTRLCDSPGNGERSSRDDRAGGERADGRATFRPAEPRHRADRHPARHCARRHRGGRQASRVSGRRPDSPHPAWQTAWSWAKKCRPDRGRPCCSGYCSGRYRCTCPPDNPDCDHPSRPRPQPLRRRSSRRWPSSARSSPSAPRVVRSSAVSGRYLLPARPRLRRMPDRRHLPTGSPRCAAASAPTRARSAAARST